MILLLLACAAEAPAPELPADPDSAIERHLITVEAELREAPVDHLDARTQAQRADLLDALHDYHLAGRWPEPPADAVLRPRPQPVAGGYEPPEGSTPLFVDAEGRHCAVGHLLDVAGYDDLVEEVVAEDNGAWLHTLLDDPEAGPALAEAAAELGFTLAELARIQPSYDFEPPPPPPLPVFAGECDTRDLRAHVERGGARAIPADYLACLDAKIVTAIKRHRWGGDAQEALNFMVNLQRIAPPEQREAPSWLGALSAEVLISPAQTVGPWAQLVLSMNDPDYDAILRTLEALHAAAEALPSSDRAHVHGVRVMALTQLGEAGGGAPEATQAKALALLPGASCARDAARSERSAAEACPAEPSSAPPRRPLR